MADSDIRALALDKIEILERVAVFKSVYFPTAWARYSEAKPGTLRLVPNAHVLRELEQDYADMQSMFFRKPPTFQQILDGLRKLEMTINQMQN
jgi:hypothetical protein